MEDSRILEIKSEYSKSGVKPFERKIKKAYNLASNEVCAIAPEYTANTFVGILEESVYSYPIGKTETCYEFIEYELTNMCRTYLEEKQENFTETWFNGFEEFLNDIEKLTSIITKVLNKYELEDKKSKICLAFPEKVLWLDKEVLASIKRLKEFGIKVAITGIGARTCPITTLAEINGDYVVLSSEMIVSEEDNVKTPLTALISYVKAIGYLVFGSCKEEEKALYRKLGANACWCD